MRVVNTSLTTNISDRYTETFRKAIKKRPHGLIFEQHEKFAGIERAREDQQLQGVEEREHHGSPAAAAAFAVGRWPENNAGCTKSRARGQSEGAC